MSITIQAGTPVPAASSGVMPHYESVSYQVCFFMSVRPVMGYPLLLGNTNISASTACSAVLSSVFGFAAVAFTGPVSMIVMGAVAGGIAAGADEMSKQAASGRTEFDWGAVAGQAAIGAVVGGLTGAVGAGKLKLNKFVKASNAKNPAITQFGKKLQKFEEKFVEKASDFGAEMVNAGVKSVSDSWKKGKDPWENLGQDLGAEAVGYGAKTAYGYGWKKAMKKYIPVASSSSSGARDASRLSVPTSAADIQIHPDRQAAARAYARQEFDPLQAGTGSYSRVKAVVNYASSNAVDTITKGFEDTAGTVAKDVYQGKFDKVQDDVVSGVTLGWIDPVKGATKLAKGGVKSYYSKYNEYSAAHKKYETPNESETSRGYDESNYVAAP